MSLHYRPDVFTYCSGSYLAKKESKVAQVDKGEGVVVKMQVDALSMEIGFMGATTPMIVYSTEVVGQHMAEMIDWQVHNGIKVQNTREKMWTMKDEHEDTKGEWMHYVQGCNMNRIPLACPTSIVEVIKASFGLYSRFVQLHLQFLDTQPLIQADKNTCLWSGFPH